MCQASTSVDLNDMRDGPWISKCDHPHPSGHDSSTGTKVEVDAVSMSRVVS